MQTYNGMLVIANKNGKEGILDKNLKIVIPFEYDDISPTSDGIVFAKKDGQNGYLNIEKNEFTPNPNIVDFISEEELIEESYKQVKQKRDKFGITDENGILTLLPIYDAVEPWNHSPSFFVEYADGTSTNLEQRYLIYKDGKVGIASDSQVITAPIYDEIGTEEVMTAYIPYPAFIAKKDGLYGYINNDGEPLSDFLYSSIFFPNPSCIGQCRRNDIDCYEFVNLDTKKVIYTDTNSEIITYSVKFDHLIMLTKDDKYKVYNSNGELLSEFNNNANLKSAQIEYLNDKVLCYKLENNSNNKVRCGLVDYSGKIITDAVYSGFVAFMNSDVLIGDSVFCNKSSILDSTGKIIKGNIFGAGGSGVYKNGLSKLPITYWKDSDSVELEAYTGEEPTEEEILYNSIYEKFKDEENCIIVSDYGEPYVYVARERELCVYDKDKNLISKIDFIMQKPQIIQPDDFE